MRGAGRRGGTRGNHFRVMEKPPTWVKACGLDAAVLSHHRHQTCLATSPSEHLRSSFGESIYVFCRVCVCFSIIDDIKLLTTEFIMRLSQTDTPRGESILL